MPLTDLLPACPFRPLDWRLRLAELVRDGVAPPRRLRLRPDPLTRRAAIPLAGSARRRGPRDAAIRAALDLREEPRRPEVEARLLAGQSDWEIAARCGLDPAAVAAYADLVYDVRPILGAPDAVAARALGPAAYPGPRPSDRATIAKVVAYGLGPLALEALLARWARGDAPAASPTARDLDRAFDLLVAAMTLPVEGRGGVLTLRLLARALTREAADGETRLDLLANPSIEAAVAAFRVDLYAADAVAAEGIFAGADDGVAAALVIGPEPPGRSNYGPAPVAAEDVDEATSDREEPPPIRLAASA